jgi:hypothetical protein
MPSAAESHASTHASHPAPSWEHSSSPPSSGEEDN